MHHFSLVALQQACINANVGSRIGAKIKKRADFYKPAQFIDILHQQQTN
jgi:hypothetical protein